MNYRAMPTIPKWAFILGDALMLLVAFTIVIWTDGAMSLGRITLLVICVLAGACLSIIPYLLEFRAAVKFTDVDNLISAATQIKNLQGVAQQIGQATSQWQAVQEHCAHTVTSAKEIGERIAIEAQAFTDFMRQAGDAERNHLRLEVEKLHRGEQECLQVLVRLMDHIFALYVAGVKSGQAPLAEQLGQFQNACRDAIRRVGLVPVEAKAGEAFDAAHHQLPDGALPAQEPCVVAETLATGYTFQRQVLRQPMVVVRPPAAPATAGSSKAKVAASGPAATGELRGASPRSTTIEAPGLFDEPPPTRKP